MDYFQKKYIEDNLPPHSEPVYNEFVWKKSEVTGGIQSVNIALNKNANVFFIIIHKMQFSLYSSGTPTSFYDSRNLTTPIFTFAATFNSYFVDIYNFDFVSKGNAFKLNCSNADPAFVYFSLMYQTVTTKERKQ